MISKVIDCTTYTILKKLITYDDFLVINIGETGLGKSTLMDSLFNTNFDSTPSSHKVRYLQDAVTK